ncbi:MAG: TetR/AcrR family transcriptional regulator [Rhizobiaceae bacterium]|nr:TetR/AcrR family transcriptional regulator [Rhizobiaceae bacterium]
MTQKAGKAAYHHGDLRKALLEAAERELDEKGIEAFSLRGVAKRAGVSHAAPAHHFKDTAALLTALAAVAAERFYHAMKARQAMARPDPHAQFIASGVGYIDFAVQNPGLFKLMFGSERPKSDDPSLVEHATNGFMVLVKDVADMTRRNPMEVDEGRLDVMAAWGLVHGVANLLVAGRGFVIDALLERDGDAALERLIDRATPPSFRRPSK